MLTIKTWCLPRELSEEKLRSLHDSIVAAVISIPATNVRSESDMFNLFSPDMMMYGLGREIKIEVIDIPPCMNQTDRNQLARKIGQAVKDIFGEANVFCEVRKPNPEDGKWSSN